MPRKKKQTAPVVEAPSLFDAPATPEPVEATAPVEQPAAVAPEEDLPAAVEAPPVEQPATETVSAPDAPAPAVEVEQAAEVADPIEERYDDDSAAGNADAAASAPAVEAPAPKAKKKRRSRKALPTPKIPENLPSLLEVGEIKNDETAGERMRRLAVVTTIDWKWLGNLKQTSKAKNATAAKAAGVSSARVFKSQLIVIDKAEEEWAALNSFRTRVTTWWHGLTLPWVSGGEKKDGERLLPRAQWDYFKGMLDAFAVELEGLCDHFDIALPRLRLTAARELGDNYKPEWLNVNARQTFTLFGDAVEVEPPQWMQELRPGDFQRQSAQLMARFEAAATLATETLAAKLLKAVAQLEERLTPDPNTGDCKTFRDSSVENLRGFIADFRTLNISGDAQLEGLVSRLEQMIKGVSADEIRAFGTPLQDKLRGELTTLADQLERDYMIEEPKRARNIIRATAPPPESSEDNAA